MESLLPLSQNMVKILIRNVASIGPISHDRGTVDNQHGDADPGEHDGVDLSVGDRATPA